MPTYYEVLGIPSGATDEQIRHAYRRLVKDAHPDAAGDPARFRLVTEAYDVLSDPARRAAYDRGRAPAMAPAAPARRRPIGRYVAVLVALAVAGGVISLVVATVRQSVGDPCLVGRWRGEEFEVPFRGTVDGRDITASLRGGAGVTLTVHADGQVRVDYGTAAPVAGADGPYRIEGLYTGTSIERWEGADGRVRTTSDSSRVRLLVTANGQATGPPRAVTVLDGELPYACTPATLVVGPYRYAR